MNPSTGRRSAPWSSIVRRGLLGLRRSLTNETSTGAQVTGAQRVDLGSRVRRVLHVAPYLSSEGAYGGPTSVAEDSCAALTEYGLDVKLLIGWDGSCPAPGTPFDTVRARAFRLSRRSFASLVSPSLIWWLMRHGRTFDVIHVHLARDLTTLPAAVVALLQKRRVVLQPHGMIQPHRSKIARALDRSIVRRVMTSSSAVLALTDVEEEGLRQLAPSAPLVRIVNFAPPTDLRASWSDKSPLVVYLSRLHPRKRPMAFVEAAAIVRNSRPGVDFQIWGPDEGELDLLVTAIRDLDLENVVKYRGTCARSESMGILSRAQIFVLPSFAEPFPVAALEACAVGLPIVLTEDTGISEMLGSTGAAQITDGSPQSMAQAILLLLNDFDKWSSASVAALASSRNEFGSGRSTSVLVEVYGSDGRTAGPSDWSISKP